MVYSLKLGIVLDKVRFMARTTSWKCWIHLRRSPWSGGCPESGKLKAMLTEHTAKSVAASVAALFVFHYAVQYWLYGNATCQDLLTDGAYHWDGKWQPYTCMVHNYNILETSACVKGKKIVLVGDSRIRQIYDGLLTFHGVVQEEHEKHSNKKHTFEEQNAVIEFLWYPEVTDSAVDLYKNFLKGDLSPSLVIHGAATWTIKRHMASFDALASYKANMTKLASAMHDFAQKSEVIWMMQAPVKREKFDERREMITNSQINLYNEAAASALKETDVELWRSAEAIAGMYHGDEDNEDDDGLHVPAEVINEYLRIIFNWYCNGPLKPRATTCCVSDRPRPNIVQISCLIFFLFCSLVTIYYFFAIKKTQSQVTNSEDKSSNATASGAIAEVVVENSDSTNKDEQLVALRNKYQLFWSLTKFGIIMGYFYICDRTDIFPRVNKHFNIMYFAIPLLAFLVYGVWDKKKVKRPDILNVEQTTEWKGWMQLIILVYHFTGASKTIPIYMQLRDIVAAYFFLSGFSQFFVSWSKEKFGLLRVCEVVFRYNFFVFFLCLVMDRQYQLYYFVPLITFWYFVIYITMAIVPRATKAKAEEDSKYYFIMIIKLVVLAVAIILLSSSRTLFDYIFDIPPTNELFRFPDTSLYEWWFRWSLDRYIVPVGMAFSFLLLTSKAKGWIDDSHAGDIFSRTSSIILTLVGFTLHAINIGRTFFCTDKPSCNRIHPYISFIPILSVILFRNILGILRIHYSVFFAYVGAMSLELFVGQYHVWLAEDTVGILALVPGYPIVNVFVTSFIFVCISLEVRDISGVVTMAIIPRADKDNPGQAERCMMKRLFVFILLLLALYLHKFARVKI